jgi:hypothetical protein
MSKNIKVLISIIIGIIALYIAKVNYNDHSRNKSILACVIAQKQKSENITSEEAKKYCEEEIKKNL